MPTQPNPLSALQYDWSFQWQRNRYGHRVVQETIKINDGDHGFSTREESLIVPKTNRLEGNDVLPVDSCSLDFEAYLPFNEENGISVSFSQLHSEDDVLKFADKYGLLGLEHVRRHRNLVDFYWIAERVDMWLDEAETLRNVYEVSEILRTQDERRLKKVVCWEDDGTVLAKFPRRNSERHRELFITRKAGDRSWLKDRRYRDPFAPAKLFLANEFNGNMAELASPTLRLDSMGRIQPYTEPTCLLSAIWVELEGLITGLRRRLRCEVCRHWLDVTDKRSDKRMHDKCSHRRKMARYRNKKRDSNEGA